MLAPRPLSLALDGVKAMRQSTKDLNVIGEELVRCSRPCTGVHCSRRTGHIPRCLYFEVVGRRGRQGSIVVGLNPGGSSVFQRRYLLERGCTFAAVSSWFVDHGMRYPYYAHLRRLLDCLGLDGPILWTELAHCENEAGVAQLPLQTFRTCTRAFLQRELALFPEAWPLVAVGTEAYKGLAYRFPERTVIGASHPTGSRGHFHSLFKGGRLRSRAAALGRQALRTKAAAIWLVA